MASEFPQMRCARVEWLHVAQGTSKNSACGAEAAASGSPGIGRWLELAAPCSSPSSSLDELMACWPLDVASLSSSSGLPSQVGILLRRCRMRRRKGRTDPGRPRTRGAWSCSRRFGGGSEPPSRRSASSGRAAEPAIQVLRPSSPLSFVAFLGAREATARNARRSSSSSSLRVGSMALSKMDCTRSVACAPDMCDLRMKSAIPPWLLPKLPPSEAQRSELWLRGSGPPFWRRTRR
mmetsp:Transcript_59685/g.192059  ORF Transcript_59685/g.192059 Transcript_59685/m.192059 type:complete len:235 (+) Transcript_59685:43-747(+)